MKIALGVTGGIAAYKAAELVRLLQDRDVRVQVVMTRAAQEFVRPLTFAALSGEKVITDLFGEGAQEPNIESAVEHIAVTFDETSRDRDGRADETGIGRRRCRVGVEDLQGR